MATFTRRRLAGAITLAICTAAQADEALELQPTTVVSAAGYEQNIAKAPASISVITREQLQKQAYGSIVDAVKNIPGVYVTGGGQMQDISIRGMTAGYTLYLVDGRPLSAGRSVNTNGSDGGKQIGLPPLSAIERIEVIRGPMSSLYGSEAMGGVINIITRKGSDDWHGTVSSEYSRSLNDLQNDEHHTSLYLSGALLPGLLGLRLDGAFSRTEEADFAGGDDSAASTPDGRRRQGSAELYFTPDSRNRFALGYQAARLDESAHPGRSIAAGAVASSTEYDKDVLVLSHDGHYDNLQLSSYLQKDVSERVQELTKQEEVVTFNTQASYFLGDHVFTLGGRYKEEQLTREDNGLLSLLPEAVGEMDRWIAAVYGEIDWGLTDDLRVTTGARYDDDEFFGGQVSPRLYALYSLTPELTLKGGVSTGYKQPSLTDATEGFGGTTGGGGWQSVAPHARAISIGNPELKPETSTNYELGFNYSDPAAGLSTSLMLFHTLYQDKIAEDRFCSTDASGTANRNNYAAWSCSYGGERWYFLSTRQNIDEAVVRGLEWTLEYDILPALRLTSSYTYTESEQKSGEFKGEPLNKQPRHMANALLDWQVNERLSAWLQGNYRSATSDYISRTSMSEGTPGYGFVDIGGVYRLTRNVDLKAGLYNLANKEVTNEDYEVVLDGRRLVVGVSVDF